MARPPEPQNLQELDTQLRQWRQGDCSIGAEWFLLGIDPAKPLTTEAQTAAAAGADAAEFEASGFMVTSQTCDIVRDCKERPFVEIAPLVAVEEQYLQEIRKGRRPSYAFVPALEKQGLVADLERTMTVEKPYLLKRARIAGCRTDDETRSLALALARKRNRFAFPDDFAAAASRLRKRILSKHKKPQSPEGESLRALSEIRVRAAPDWNADVVELTFFFVREEDDDPPGEFEWNERLEKWLALVDIGGRFHRIDGIVCTLADLTAQEYVESDPLDLEHLSES